MQRNRMYLVKPITQQGSRKQEADLTLGLCDLYTLLRDHVSVPRSPDFARVVKFKSHVQCAVEFRAESRRLRQVQYSVMYVSATTNVMGRPVGWLSDDASPR